MCSSSAIQGIEAILACFIVLRDPHAIDVCKEYCNATCRMQIIDVIFYTHLEGQISCGRGRGIR